MWSKALCFEFKRKLDELIRKKHCSEVQQCHLYTTDILSFYDAAIISPKRFPTVLRPSRYCSREVLIAAATAEKKSKMDPKAFNGFPIVIKLQINYQEFSDKLFLKLIQIFFVEFGVRLKIFFGCRTRLRSERFFFHFGAKKSRNVSLIERNSK